MPRFDQIGAALRYLRLHGGSAPSKQLEIAARADVTRGMLSSYERGHQVPTLPTLDRLLGALDADLVKLQWALHRVQPAREGEPEGEAPGPPEVPLPTLDWRHIDEVAERRAVYRAVQVPEPLEPEEEHALGQMIAGFLAYLRYTRDQDREG
jgi:transcriptional regulator with XRE-family HTH domain